MQQCENYRFWAQYDKPFQFNGNCRRHAPAHFRDEEGFVSNEPMWPKISSSDFCGDFEEK